MLFVEDLVCALNFQIASTKNHFKNLVQSTFNIYLLIFLQYL